MIACMVQNLNSASSTSDPRARSTSRGPGLLKLVGLLNIPVGSVQGGSGSGYHNHADDADGEERDDDTGDDDEARQH